MVLGVGEVVHGKVPQALLDGLFDKGQDEDRHRQGAGSSWQDDQQKQLHDGVLEQQGGEGQRDVVQDGEVLSDVGLDGAGQCDGHRDDVSEQHDADQDDVKQYDGQGGVGGDRGLDGGRQDDRVWDSWHE